MALLSKATYSDRSIPPLPTRGKGTAAAAAPQGLGALRDDRGRPRLPSIPCIPGRARERNRVAHIGKPGDVGKRALEAEAEARMRHGAVAAQVAVPGVMLLVDVALGQARVEHIEPL